MVSRGEDGDDGSVVQNYLEEPTTKLADVAFDHDLVYPCLTHLLSFLQAVSCDQRKTCERFA